MEENKINLISNFTKCTGFGGFYYSTVRKRREYRLVFLELQFIYSTYLVHFR